MVTDALTYVLESREIIYSSGRFILDYINLLFDSIFNITLIITFVLTLIYLLIGINVIFGKKNKKEFINLKDSELPTVTIQIPTYNELAAINCAKKCLKFDYPKAKFDIIIGDDSNDKSISKKFEAFAKKFSNVNVTRRGLNIGFKPGNLNNMLTYTKGELIVIFDSDFLPGKDFLKKMVVPMVRDKNLAGAQARWKVHNPTQNIATIIGTGIVNTFHKIVLPFVTKVSSTIVFCGSAEIIRKEYLLENGGWKSGVLTEDIDYSLRAISSGHPIKYIDAVECYCEVPQTILDLFKQQKRWGYGVIRALIENRKSLKESTTKIKGRNTMLFLFSSGYIFTVAIFLLTIFGILSIVTHRPEAIQWGLFMSETIRNVILTCGLTIITLMAAIISNTSKVNFIKLVIGTFTIGLVLVLYVVQGIYLALVNEPMKWYMLKKNGNEI